jgi:asparagine synthase (glutamine-hydrolysing)
MARLDNPVGDPLTAPNLLLSERAAADGFREVLNGEGGDPCFGGPKNLPMLLFELYRSDPDPAARARAYLRAYRNCYEDLPMLLSRAALEDLHAAPPVERLVLPYLEASTMSAYLNRLMLANVRTKGAHHILTKVESLTSSCGLRAHSPLFNRAVVEYSFVIPPHLKLVGTTEKWILKQAVRDLLPALIVDRPKSGMRVPLYYWLDGPLGHVVQEVLLSEQGRSRGLFRPATLRAWLRGEAALWPRHASKLWLVLSLELWLRAYLDNATYVPEPMPRRWWRVPYKYSMNRL